MIPLANIGEDEREIEVSMGSGAEKELIECKCRKDLLGRVCVAENL